MSQRRRSRVGLLPRAQKVCTYVALAVCGTSGLAYVLKHDAGLAIFDIGAHDFLVAHGVSAALLLVVFGAVLPLHVRASWNARRNRSSGAAMVAALSFLSVTGLLLYYGSEDQRDLAIWAHWIAGFVAFVLFPLHLVLGARFSRAN